MDDETAEIELVCRTQQPSHPTIDTVTARTESPEDETDLSTYDR